MNSAVLNIAKDFFARGRWILLAMSALQVVFALTMLGVIQTNATYVVLPLMMTGVAPLLAPSRRNLSTFPMTSAAVDRMQWLSGGGGVALIASTANLIACAAAFLLGSLAALPASTLLLGTPGSIGLLMLLRRWTTGGNANNQNRPALLSNYFYPPLVMIAMEILKSTGPLSIAAFCLLCAGWIPLLAFLISPESYYRWSNRSLSITNRRDARRTFHWSYRFNFTSAIVTLVVCVFGVLIAWPSSLSAQKRASMLTVLGVMWLLFVIVWLPSVRVLRSLPQSLNRFTVRLIAATLIPTSLGLIANAAACAAFGHAPIATMLSLVLPSIALSAPVVPLMLYLITRGILSRLRWLPIFIVVALLAPIAGSALHEWIAAHLAMTNVLAILVLVFVFLCMRAIFREHPMSFRAFNSNPLWTS